MSSMSLALSQFFRKNMWKNNGFRGNSFPGKLAGKKTSTQKIGREKCTRPAVRVSVRRPSLSALKDYLQASLKLNYNNRVVG